MSEDAKVLGYLRSISPSRATNEEIRVNTGVKPHPKVYQITQRLVKTGQIEGRKAGLEWIFWIDDRAEQELPEPTAEQTLPEPPAEQEAPEEPTRGSNADKVLRYLRSISPTPATNDEIRVNTGVKPSPEVYQITQRLVETGQIEGRKGGLEWVFWIAAQGEQEVSEPKAEPILTEPVAEQEMPAPMTEPEAPAPMTEPEAPAPTVEREPPAPTVEREPPAPTIEPEPTEPTVEREPAAPAVEREPPAPTIEPEPTEPAVEPERSEPMAASEKPAAPESGHGRPSPSQFETEALGVMSEHFDAELGPGSVPGVRREFGLVSADRRIVGDAHYCSRVRDDLLPLAEFSRIAEHVWFLEKTDARYRFVVFGNDEQAPLQWLKRYGNLTGDVEFYYLNDDGRLKRLASS